MSDKETVIFVEELCVMKMTQSNDNNSNIADNSERPNDIFSAEESSKLAGIAELMKKPVQTGKQKIQKVPMVLRGNKNFEKFYEPRAIAIGPIHHKNKNLQLAQQYKAGLAAKFINESGKTPQEVYMKIKAEMKALKLLFDPEVIKDYKEEELRWMLFLDGCSTLQFMYGVIHEKMSEYNIKNDQVAFAQQDLFLLENQIPLKVLNLLLDSSQAKVDLKNSIKRFLQMNVMAPSHMGNSTDLDNIDIDNEDSIHLLELLQKFAVFPPPEKEKWSKKLTKYLSNGLVKRKPLQKCAVFPPSEKEKCSKKLAKYLPNGLIKRKHIGQQSFRNVQELKAAGVKLKPSENGSLRDIDFTSRGFTGWLELPPLVVDESTGPKLLNMIAYEMCPDNFSTDYEVSTYVSLLDSLIAHSNDVQELRSAKILYNCLGSDEEVAQLFNEIATNLVRSPWLIGRIQRYFDQRLTTLVSSWMAEAYNTYFKSPWAILAFLGALIALALTIVQTWYAINPPSDNHRN